MQWQYRTILFEFQKDGLLGSQYVDDEIMEKTLNEQGELGWELVSVTAIAEGLLAFCKRPVRAGATVDVSIEKEPQETETPEEYTENITVASIQEQEREHIQELENQRREEMIERERLLVGEIKIG